MSQRKKADRPARQRTRERISAVTEIGLRVGEKLRIGDTLILKVLRTAGNQASICVDKVSDRGINMPDGANVTVKEKPPRQARAIVISNTRRRLAAKRGDPTGPGLIDLPEIAAVSTALRKEEPGMADRILNDIVSTLAQYPVTDVARVRIDEARRHRAADLLREAAALLETEFAGEASLVRLNRLGRENSLMNYRNAWPWNLRVLARLIQWGRELAPVEPRLIGRRGRAMDVEGARRAAFIRQLDKLLPRSIRANRYALIAKLLTTADPRLPTTRALVRSTLFGGHTNAADRAGRTRKD